MKTTDFQKKQEHVFHQTPCHGGEGAWYFKDYLNGMEDRQNALLKFLHDDILPPGSSFGIHKHGEENICEEWYLCLEGKGIMILDGKEVPFEEGDINVCRNGGSHGIKNTGKENMRFLVINVQAPSSK